MNNDKKAHLRAALERMMGVPLSAVVGSGQESNATAAGSSMAAAAASSGTMTIGDDNCVVLRGTALKELCDLLRRSDCSLTTLEYVLRG